MTRRLLITLAAAVLFVPAVWAQAPEAAPERAAARLEELKQRLKLTPDQEEKVRPIFQEEIEQARALLQNFDRDSASRRTKMKTARELKAIQEDTDRKLKTVLTNDQMKELKRIREERRQKVKAAR